MRGARGGELGHTVGSHLTQSCHSLGLHPSPGAFPGLWVPIFLPPILVHQGPVFSASSRVFLPMSLCFPSCLCPRPLLLSLILFLWFMYKQPIPLPTLELLQINFLLLCFKAPSHTLETGTSFSTVRKEGIWCLFLLITY